MRRRIAARSLFGVALLALLSITTSYVLAGSSTVSMSASVSPSVAVSADKVTYTIEIENVDENEAGGAAIEVTLPDGFTYVSGSTSIAYNGVTVAGADPTQSGVTLRWSNLTIPGARQTSIYGMHTFVQDSCNTTYINQQLNWVVEVVGENSYAKQLIKDVEASWTGPKQCWIDFVNACYNRNITPVIRLAGTYGSNVWNEPVADSPGNYTSIAAAFARVVDGLPTRDGHLLYIEIWNEPNLNLEWGGEANPEEYAAMAVDVAAAIRALGDDHIVIMNGGLSPYGDIAPLAFIDRMARVDGWLNSFDVWASHTYPGNRPPEYNLHDGTATTYTELSIDSYMIELERLAQYGRDDLQVLVTETGYALGASNLSSQYGYAVIGESNRADYMLRAMSDYWAQWPEVLGVCPFELVDPNGNWDVWDWRDNSGSTHTQYDVLAAASKPSVLAEGTLEITFEARVGGEAGTQTIDVSLTTPSNGGVSFSNVAPVRVQTSTSPTVTPTPTPISVPSVCSEVCENGGFEYSGEWTIPDTNYDAIYSTAQAHAGSRSLRVGIVGETPVWSYSSAYQSFQMPGDAVGVAIDLWYYPISLDPANGLQYVMLYSKQDGSLQYEETLLWIASNNQEWTHVEFEISGHAGEELYLYIGARNSDSPTSSGATAMYVDDVSIQVCVSSGATPVPTTPQPTGTLVWQLPLIYRYAEMPVVEPTPAPVQGCVEMVTNGSCETDSAWIFSETAYPANYTSDAYEGSRALRLGIVDSGGNVFSYSSAEQKITLPQAADIALVFWAKYVSLDTAGDSQYILVLDESQSNYDTLLRSRNNTSAWNAYYYDLTAYAGQTIWLRFGVINDGTEGVTSMLVDNISIEACDITSSSMSAFAVEPTPTPSSIEGVAEGLIAALPVTYDLVDGDISLADVSVADAKVSMLQVDEMRQRMVLTQYKGITSIDLLSGEIIYARDYSSPVGRIGLDAATGRVTVPLLEDGCVEVLDRNGNLLTTVNDVGKPVASVLTGQGLLIADAADNQLVLADAESGAIISRLALETIPDMMLLDESNGKLYVAEPEASRLALINTTNLAIESYIELTGTAMPADMVLDSERNRLYIVNSLSAKYGGIQAIDTLTGRITASLWGNPTEPLSIANHVQLSADGESVILLTPTTMYLLDPYTLEIISQQALVPEGYSRASDLDTTTGELYVADGPIRVTRTEGLSGEVD